MRLMTTARQQQLLLPPSPVDRPLQVSSRIRARASPRSSLARKLEAAAWRAAPALGQARPARALDSRSLCLHKRNTAAALNHRRRRPG